MQANLGAAQRSVADGVHRRRAPGVHTRFVIIQAIPTRKRTDKVQPRSEIAGLSGPETTSDVKSIEKQAAESALSFRSRSGALASQRLSMD